MTNMVKQYIDNDVHGLDFRQVEQDIYDKMKRDSRFDQILTKTRKYAKREGRDIPRKHILENMAFMFFSHHDACADDFFSKVDAGRIPKILYSHLEHFY